VTAARLAADQAQVDRSNADLVAARLAARAATLRAPVDGEVVAVDVASGDAADTSSTAVTLVGAGATTVTGSVSLAQVPSVRRGQTARVLLSGATKAVTGTVTQVGLVPASDSNGSTTYPVTIAVPDQSGTAVPQGTTASVEVVTGSAHHVVTVPTSAVTMVGDNRATVDVLEDGTPKTKVVTVGIVGGVLTSITSGLDAGQRVVLADLGASLPSDDTTNRRGFGGNFKGFGNSPVIIRNGGPARKG
jgi:HlyD family secretion protein